ncbi:hypothetical protein TWF192_011263 [Orbilia oligospora]|uniref:Uncharacterized protein n=1 Tax=Orbilia oligospora TaxID=2813651 RepID=A0A6G1LY38_ORBOL|nr:hypothetical protein TWF191_008715 [Orbilia oligospora]KAF3236941.1 hypothetical protein TWF192_011263 [Orbilia oligospora]
MGQYWSSWSHDLVLYNPGKHPRGVPFRWLFIRGYFGAFTVDSVEDFFVDYTNPEGLLNELRKFDMVGLVVERYKTWPPSLRELYIIGEDEICDSIVSRPYTRFWAIYPARYKGFVPYYVGCDTFQVETFQRPKRLDLQSPERVRDLENLDIGSQDWSLAYKKIV